MPVRQSFCYPLYAKGRSPAELFDAVRRIGYPATEFWFRDAELEQLVDEALAAGLTVASICGHTSLTDGLNNPADHDRINGELLESIDYATAHGIGGLICFSGNRREGQTDDEAIDACVAGLRRAAPAAERAGINLNLELLNSRVDHPGYQADRSRWGLEVVRRVGSPRAKLLYDIYHMQIMEGDVIRTLTENVQWIGHIHTAGNPGRRDMDDRQELNYTAICRALSAAGYEGYVGHEFTPRGEPLEALRAAFQTCNA